MQNSLATVLALFAGTAPGQNSTGDFPVLDIEDIRQFGVDGIEDVIKQAQASCPVTFRSESAARFRLDGSDSVWFGTPALAVRAPSSPTFRGDSAKLDWYSELFDSAPLVGEAAAANDKAVEESLHVSILHFYEGPDSASIGVPTAVDLDGHMHWQTAIDFPDPGCWVVLGSYQEHLLSLIVESAPE